MTVDMICLHKAASKRIKTAETGAKNPSISPADLGYKENCQVPTPRKLSTQLGWEYKSCPCVFYFIYYLLLFYMQFSFVHLKQNKSLGLAENFTS